MTTGPVNGVVDDVYVTAGGDVTVPTDLSATPVESYVDDGSGGLTRYPGSGHTDGSFAVPGVPAGATFDLRIGRSYYVTSRRHLELGQTFVRRPDAAFPTGAPLLEVNVSGLAPWKQGDDLELMSPASGVRFSLLGPASVRPDAGVTTLSGALNYPMFSEGRLQPLLDTSAGDHVYLGQLVSRTATTATGTTQTYAALDRIVSVPSLVITDGTETSLTAALQPIASHKTLTLAWHGDAFHSLLSDLCGADSEQPLYFEAFATPFPDRGPDGAHAELASTLLPGQQVTFQVAYADPFPATWGRVVFADTGCRHRSGFYAPLASYAVEPLANAADGLRPAIGPARDIQIDGQSTSRPLAENDPLLTSSNPGDNTFSCNADGDLVTSAAGLTIDADGKAWDHVPPTVGTDGTTDDIVSTDPTTQIATLAANPCP